MAEEIEIWKPVLGYEDFYAVSNLSNVKRIYVEKSIFRYGKFQLFRHKERYLIGQVNPDGYLTVELSFSGCRRTAFKHRLSAIAFIPNPNNYDTVNHINGIKTDNRIENLEWMKNYDNVQDYWTRRRATKKFYSSPKSKLSLSEIVHIKILLSKGLSVIEVSDKLSISRSIIYSIKNNATWKDVEI
jgi:hypothetical protein